MFENEYKGLIFEQYLLMRKDLRLFAVVLLFATVSCIHLRHQQKIYDSELYLSELQARQDRLYDDLKAIQQMYNQFDQNILDAAKDQKLKLSLLQEGLADERDSLYSIQQYLNLPFNQRSCQCFNFTDDLRQKLQQSIEQIGQSILDIQSKTKECSDCAMVIEIKREIEQQKNYLQIMKDTLDSKCCTVYDTVYLENLNSANWMYGNQDPEEYRQSVDAMKAEYENNKTLVRTCPISQPFPSADFTSCTNCDDTNLIFNLETRTCIQCPIGKIFNYATRTCDFNVTCPAGTKFNEKTVICEKVRPSINDSLCPPETPIWNPEVLGCFKCESEQPYFDEFLAKCTACPEGTVYHPQAAECVNENCEVGQIFNQESGQCESKDSNIPRNVSTSNCPPEKPFWDKNSYSCSQCPTDAPFFNSTIQKCQECPADSTYDSSMNKCFKRCPDGQVLNITTWKCEDVEVVPVEPSTGDNTGICPPERPIWDAESKSCVKCNSDKPFWNQETQQCQICSQTQQWDQDKRVCVAKDLSATCKDGQVYNEQKNACESKTLTGTLGICPPELPFYNKDHMVCEKCPSDKPYFYEDQQKCSSEPKQESPTPTTCLENQHFDQTSKKCVDNAPVGSGSSAKCPPETPYWNKDSMRCQTCQQNLLWDPINKVCVEQLPVEKVECGFNQQWSDEQNACRKCQDYQKYLVEEKICGDFCQPGQYYDSNYDRCLGTISKCPLGLNFDARQLRCKCPEGLNYRYVPDKEECEKFCLQDQEYDYKTRGCIPTY